MFASRAYFSLSEITDPARHRAHNEWHQLDHQPENFVLPGVAAGSRWVRPPDCAAASAVVAPGYANVHYAIMYWFREPLARSLEDFFILSERSFQWGRSPQIGFTHRPMRGFFVPTKGYAAPRIDLPPDALAYRPVKGMLATLSRVERRDDEAAALARWYDEVRIPDLLECPGVAGAWTLAAEEADAPGAWPFADRGARAGAAVPNRLQLLYLDEDPLAVLEAIDARTPAWRRAGRLRDNSAVEEIVFASPLRAIVAWEWDWFAGSARR